LRDEGTQLMKSASGAALPSPTITGEFLVAWMRTPISRPRRSPASPSASMPSTMNWLLSAAWLIVASSSTDSCIGVFARAHAAGLGTWRVADAGVALDQQARHTAVAEFDRQRQTHRPGANDQDPRLRGPVPRCGIGMFPLSFPCAASTTGGRQPPRGHVVGGLRPRRPRIVACAGADYACAQPLQRITRSTA
jgi:hypothetical protein